MQLLLLAFTAAILYRVFAPRSSSSSPSSSEGAGGSGGGDRESAFGSNGGGEGRQAVTGPAGSYVERSTFGAEAPMVPGERVLFELRTTDVSLGKLEGAYDGPEDPADMVARVFVDRIAVAPSSEVPVPAFGTYTIPASTSHAYDSFLERVVWTPTPPDAANAKTYSVDVLLSLGDRVTVVVEDGQLTKVLAVARIIGQTVSGELTAVLDKPWRIVSNSGLGAVVFPKVQAQATIKFPKSYLVDPSTVA